MSIEAIDLNPVEHITVNAAGGSGERTFLLQGRSGERLVTLVIDQDHILALSLAGSELLDLLEEEYSRELNQFQIPLPESMVLQMPIEPLFEIAQFQLGYDAQSDYLVIITIELPGNWKPDSENLTSVRFWITREQMLALIRQIDRVVSAHLFICPACGEPVDPEGHRCLRSN